MNNQGQPTCSMDKATLSDHTFHLAIGFTAVTSIVYAFSFLINDKIDWMVLLFLVPDSYIPLIDECMLFITEFSILIFALLFLSWKMAYHLSGQGKNPKTYAEKTLKAMGIGLAGFAVSGYFWGPYAHSMLVFPLALSILLGFRQISNIIKKCDADKLQQINSLFWATFLATLLSQLSTEHIKCFVDRPRPLSTAYADYNIGLRAVAGELVVWGGSYVSGHATVFFAMITPILCFTSDSKIKAGLFLWALLHSFTRVYFASHFPYDSLMGSMLGFGIAISVVKTLGTHMMMKPSNDSPSSQTQEQQV